MNKVQSKDGTIIAFDRSGDGPPVILLCGASTDRMANAPLAKLLVEHFTVFNYDRRGRGDSGDTPPYAVERAAIRPRGRSRVVDEGAQGGRLRPAKRLRRPQALQEEALFAYHVRWG